MEFPDARHFKAEQLALALELELKRLGRWQADPLPPEKLEHMGAFGENTMAFEQWIQFILVVRLRQMARQELEFPDSSNLGAYAVRAMDGDDEAEHLRELLTEIDAFIEDMQTPKVITPRPAGSETVTLGSDKVPDVLITLAALLPQYEGADLESQLQTFDTFISILSPKAKLDIAELLRQAASKAENETTRTRILQVATSIMDGGRTAEPYDHEAAMKKYQEEHRRNFPDLPSMG